MRKKNFLILTEGSTDALSVSKYIKENFRKFLKIKLCEYPELNKKFGTEVSVRISLSRNENLNDMDELKITLPIFEINKNIEQKIIIYIKNSTNQNISNFIINMKNYSPEKMYNLENIYQTYSIFDSDLGSTTNAQIKEYFKLEDINSILNCPCLESLEFQGSYIELYKGKDKFYKKSIGLSDKIIIEEESIFVNERNKEKNSQYIKEYSNLLNNIKGKTFENSHEYIKKNVDLRESWDIIENREKIYIENILQGKKNLVISFIPTILENIIDLIIDADE